MKSELAGNTPIVQVEIRNEVPIYLKLEGANPSGALKDRLVEHVLSDKNLTGKTLLDASSGSHGCAIAYWGAKHNVPVHVVSNEKISDENRVAILALGAKFSLHGSVTRESREYCEHLVSEHPEKYFFFDQLGRFGAHPAYHAIADEILHDVPEVHAIVASKGSGVTLLGICDRLQGHPVQVFGVIGIAGDKSIVGTYKPGADYETKSIRKLQVTKQYCAEQEVSHNEVMCAWKEILKSGVLIGPQGAGVVVAIRKLVDEGKITGPVVGIAGDTAFKHLSRIKT